MDCSIIRSILVTATVTCDQQVFSDFGAYSSEEGECKQVEVNRCVMNSALISFGDSRIQTASPNLNKAKWPFNLF